ncbi:hypothetical protein [Azorhizobium caulinodans]|uniref:hypothetical protein n=1 Tax=Azorhizobium caulinodans TaxID=7 RepID=UPI002FBD7F60
MIVDTADACDLMIDVDLEGVRSTTLNAVNVGDSLNVVMDPAGLSAICSTLDGGVLGALSAFPGIAQLMSCLRRGERYLVSVTAKGAGHCHVVGGRLTR